VYILGVAYGVQIFGGSDGVHDGYITNYEGNITKDFAVGDEINLDVPSGSITLKILELKWSPKNADWLEMVKVDYEIESEEALSADFTIEPSQNINLGDVVTFDVSSSTGDISSYDWDFGDRGKFSRTSGNKHFYMSSGTFPVTLTVKDKNGNSDSLTKTVNVYSKYENSELKISLVRNKCSQILVDYRVVLTKNAPLNVNVEKYSNGDGLPGVIVGSAFQNDAIMCAIPDIPKMVTSKCINYLIKKASEKAGKLLGPIGWISNMIDLAAYIECIQGYNFIEDDKTAGDGNLIIHIPYESAELSEKRDIGDETPQMSEAFLDTEIRDKIFKTENLQFQETPEQLIYIYKENTGLSKKTVNQQKFAYMKKIDPSDLPEGITFYYEPSIQKKEKAMPSHPKLEISVKRQIKDEDIPLVEVSICIIVNDMCQSLGSTSSDGSLRLTEDELVHIDPHGTYTLVAGDGIFYSRKKEQFTFNNDGTTHVDIVLDKKDLPTIPSYVAIFAKTPQEYPNIVTYPHANSIKNFLRNKCIYTEYIDQTNSEIRKNPTTLNEKMQAIISGSDWIIVLCSFEDIQKPFADCNPHFKFSADKKKPEDVLKEGTGWKIIKYTSENIGLSGETSQHLYYIVTEDKTNTVETAVKEFLKIIGEELGGSDGLDQLISTSIETSPDPQSTNFGTVLEDRTRTWGL
jgi:PKD repeat protein